MSDFLALYLVDQVRSVRSSVHQLNCWSLRLEDTKNNINILLLFLNIFLCYFWSTLGLEDHLLSLLNEF